MKAHIFSEIAWGQQTYGIHVEPDDQWCILPAQPGYATAQAAFYYGRGLPAEVIHFSRLRLDPKLECPSSLASGNGVVLEGIGAL